MSKSLLELKIRYRNIFLTTFFLEIEHKNIAKKWLNPLRDELLLLVQVDSHDKKDIILPVQNSSEYKVQGVH